MVFTKSGIEEKAKMLEEDFISGGDLKHGKVLEKKVRGCREWLGEKMSMEKK
jgi:hypothetical protein